MKYFLCGVLGCAIGSLLFGFLCVAAGRHRNRKFKVKGKNRKGLPKPNFTKAVLVAVLCTYFVGLYVGIRVTLADYSQFGVLATYIAAPTTTVIALYCWKAKAENIIKIKQGHPKETEGAPVDLNNIMV